MHLKYSLLAFGVTSFLFVGCKKEYECACSHDDPTSQPASRTVKAFNEEEAEEICKKDDTASFHCNLVE